MDILALESGSAAEIESKESRIEDLQRINEEVQRQVAKMQKDLDSQKSTVAKCLNVVKELLIEKSTIERKDARSKDDKSFFLLSLAQRPNKLGSIS
jgi:hypothetical protein